MTDAARWVLILDPAAIAPGELAYPRGLDPHHDGDDVEAWRVGVQATVLATS